MADFPILNLPSELKRRTASFLNPQDALRLSETCKNLHTSLSLRLLRNSRILFERGLHFNGSVTNGDRLVPFTRLPCISRRVHSLTVTFRWRDQAWGYRKGRIWVIARPRSMPIDTTLPFYGGRIVCESPVSPHDTETCTMTFSTTSSSSSSSSSQQGGAVDGEEMVYQLWYRVGGGGGHQLHLFDGRLHTVLFDDEQGNISRNYRILKNVGAIAVNSETNNNNNTNANNNAPAAPAMPFYPQLLLRVSRSLRAQLLLQQQQDGTNGASSTNTFRPPAGDEHLAQFFQMYNIPVNEGSLLALEEIIQTDLDQQTLALEEDDQIQEQADPDSEEEDDDEDDRLHDPAFHEFVQDIGNVFFGRQDIGNLLFEDRRGMGLVPPAFAFADMFPGRMGMMPPGGPPRHDDDDDDDAESIDDDDDDSDASTDSDLPPLIRRLDGDSDESSDDDADGDDDTDSEIPQLANRARSRRAGVDDNEFFEDSTSSSGGDDDEMPPLEQSGTTTTTTTTRAGGPTDPDTQMLLAQAAQACQRPAILDDDLDGDDGESTDPSLPDLLPEEMPALR